jgi:hypothetical protein
MKTPSMLLGLALLLAGCASAEPRWVWQHPSYGEERLEVDSGECRRQAAQEVASPFVFPGFGADYYDERQTLFRNCMLERGWRLQEPEKTPPPPQQERIYRRGY